MFRQVWRDKCVCELADELHPSRFKVSPIQREISCLKSGLPPRPLFMLTYASGFACTVHWRSSHGSRVERLRIPFPLPRGSDIKITAERGYKGILRAPSYCFASVIVRGWNKLWLAARLAGKSAGIADRTQNNSRTSPVIRSLVIKRPRWLLAPVCCTSVLYLRGTQVL